MENSVKNILGPLGAFLTAAEERANIAEENYARLILGLTRLVDLSPAGNDNTAEAVNSQRAKKSNSRAARPSTSCLDSDLMANLTADWVSAGTLHKLLAARGIKIAEGTVYNRMRKLASERPNEIETASRPERWRLKSRTESVGTVTSKMAKRRKQPNASSGLRVVPDARSAANENIAESHMPTLHHGNCLEVMKSIPDDSVDLILADLPYGTTRLEIDKAIPLDALWVEYRRILRKPTGNIVLFGSQPFTTALINAAPDIFRYSMVWEKNSSTGFQHAADKPLKRHEDIAVFSYGVNISVKRSKRRATYNPQGVVPKKRKATGVTNVSYLSKAVRGYAEGHEFVGLSNCPTDILPFPKDKVTKGEVAHPFAKPIALLEYLIRTYSNPGEMVLDNTMGSGSTCVAAMNAGRRSIGIEQDRSWFTLAKMRIDSLILSLAA